MPITPLPAGASKPRTGARSSLRSAAAATIAAASGCSLPRSTLAAKRSTSASSKPGAGDDRHDLRLAFGERAGLVDHQRVDLLHALQRLGVLDQHAVLRAAADADHDRHRRGQAERAGAGDDQHAHRGDQAEGKARLRPERRPGGEGDERRRDHGRHEPAGDLIGQPLDRRAAALRLRHHLHDLRQQRVAADLVGAHDEAAGAVERAADHACVLLLGHRHGFAGHHGFVERGAAFEHDAVDRHLVAGAHAQAVADRDGVERELPRRCRRP